MHRDRVRSKLNPVAASPSSIQNLHYAGQTLVFVRGPATGWVYRFSPAEPVQAVDGRDLPAMLKSPLFQNLRFQTSRLEEGQ
jgi:hypothetical protein